MPVVDYNLQATWDRAYAMPPKEYTGGFPPTLHYERRGVQ